MSAWAGAELTSTAAVVIRMMLRSLFGIRLLGVVVTTPASIAARGSRMRGQECRSTVGQSPAARITPVGEPRQPHLRRPPAEESLFDVSVFPPGQPALSLRVSCGRMARVKICIDVADLDEAGA